MGALSLKLPNNAPTPTLPRSTGRGGKRDAVTVVDRMRVLVLSRDVLVRAPMAALDAHRLQIATHHRQFTRRGSHASGTMAGMWPFFSLRPFYAVLFAHCVATYVMMGALAFFEPPTMPHPSSWEAGEILVLVLMPLLSWYMLLEATWMVSHQPWQAVYVFGSYVPVFVLTLYLVLRRKRRLRVDPDPQDPPTVAPPAIQNAPPQ